MTTRTVAATLGTLLVAFTASTASAQEGRPESPPTKDIPERYSRQVAPAPGTLWRAPDLRDYTRVLKSTEAPAHRSEQALRAARADRPRAAREPRDAGGMGGGPSGRARRRARRKRVLSGARDLRARRLQERGRPDPEEPRLRRLLPLRPGPGGSRLNLRWLLLDFGRRGSARDAAKERLLAANLGFNRKHQQIVFAVQRAFYGLTSIRARIAVAQSSLDAARAVQEATERPSANRARHASRARPRAAAGGPGLVRTGGGARRRSETRR